MPNVDPTKIVVGGHSAGGHLALCLALLKALVGPGSPPTLIVQGARDSMTAPRFARRFTERMIAAGNDCRLELVDGAHTFYSFREQTYVSFRHALHSMDEFLVELGCLARSHDLDGDIDRLGAPPQPPSTAEKRRMRRESSCARSRLQPRSRAHGIGARLAPPPDQDRSA